MANVLKAVKKFYRKPLKHARRQDVLEKKFKSIEQSDRHAGFAILRGRIDELELLCSECHKRPRPSLS